MARKTASDFFEPEPTELVSEEPKTAESEEKESLEESVKHVKDSASGSESKSETESEDSKEPLSESKNINTGQSTFTDTSNPTVDPEQQYMQYMMQYQQYYAQYYSQYYAQPQATAAVTSDPAYEYYTSSTSTGPIAPAASFDAARANKQMTAYFDPNKFQAVLSPEMQAAQRAVKEQQQARLTAKEIEAFKKKKVEKKKAKNRWFYE